MTDDLGPALGQDLAEIKLAIGALLDSAKLGDDGVDELGRGDVKGRVPHVDSLVCRRDSHLGGLVDAAVGLDDGAGNLGELLPLAFLDLDVIARHSLEINASRGRGDDELDAVLLRKHGELVSANLVGSVAVANDTVRADDDGGNVALLALGAEQGGGHGISDECAGDLLVDELKGRQAAALVVRPGLGAEGVLQQALAAKGADDAEGGAVAGCGQRPGVAVRQDGDLLLGGCASIGTEPLGAVVADGQVGLEILAEDVLGLLNECLDDVFLARAAPQASDCRLELVDGVGQVNGGRTALLEVVEGFVDVSDGVVGGGGGDGALVQLNGKTEAGDDGDGRGAADAHRGDAVKGLTACRDLIVVEFVGEAKLVEDLELATGVLDSLQSRHDSGCKR